MKIVNKTINISLSDYSVAIDRYLDKLKDLDGVISAYTMGSVGSPGISDIDVIVVVENDFELNKSFKLCVRGIDDRLFIHGPFILPLFLADKLQYIIYATNIINIYGDHSIQEIDDVGKDIIKSLKICYLIDFIESRFLQFADVDHYKIIDQRAWMTRLWSIIHSYKIYTDIGLKFDKKYFDTIKNIISLRSTWDKNRIISEDDFLSVFPKAKNVNTKIFIDVLNYAYKPEIPVAYSKRYISHYNKKIYFDVSNNIAECRLKTRKFGTKKIKAYELNLPINYAIHLSGYGFFNIPRSNYSLDPHFKVMKKRRHIVEQHLRWVQKAIPFAGSMKGYIGLLPLRHLGFKTSVENLLYKILLR